MTLRFWGLLLCVVVMLSVSSGVSAQTSETQVEDTAQISSELSTENFKKSHDALIADPDFDFDYTKPAVPKARDLPKGRKRSTRSDSMGAFFSGVGQIFQLLFWGICIALVAVILFFIIREFAHVRATRSPKPVEKEVAPVIPAYRPSKDAARFLLRDVDALAAEGRYAEAVHTLLLRSIQDIRDNRPRAVPRALTSREISTLKILSESARAAFLRIGKRVETSHFGGLPLGKEDFEISRAAYQEFAFEAPGKTVKS